MTKKSASSDATAKPCPSVYFDKSTLDEMLDKLNAVDDYLTAAEEGAVVSFDGAAERGGPADRITIDHLADTTSALHAVRDVITSIDVEVGMSSLPGSRGEFTIDMWQLGEQTGYGVETVAELYENLGDDDEGLDANQGIDLVGFVSDLIRDRGQLTDHIASIEDARRRLGDRCNQLQASLISAADQPSPAEAAHIFAAVGLGDYSNVSERSMRAHAQRVNQGMKDGGYIKLSAEDDAILEDIARKIDEGVADAEERAELLDGEVDKDFGEGKIHRHRTAPACGGGSPEGRAAARFIAIDNARRPIVVIRTAGGDEIEVR